MAYELEALQLFMRPFDSPSRVWDRLFSVQLLA